MQIMSKILDLSILRMASIKLKSSGSDKFNMNYGVDYNILEAERSSLIAQEFEQRLSVGQWIPGGFRAQY